MNFPNRSPWIEQLDRSIDYNCLSSHQKVDLTIVGAGISGVVTAFYALTQTKLSVILVEAKKIGHGATGHNAGQVALYFEKPFQEITKEFGLNMAIDGQKSLFRGFDLLMEILEKIDMTHAVESCEGYMGVRSMTQLVRHLENKYLRDV